MDAVVHRCHGMSDRIHNRPTGKPRRKNLRNAGTAAEAVLWKCRQRRQILGRKFRRQHGTGPYIVDFYCPDSRVIVELDGAAHYSPVENEYEQRRTAYLQSLGLTIVRFENREIADDLEAVVEMIRQAVD